MSGGQITLTLNGNSTTAASPGPAKSSGSTLPNKDAFEKGVVNIAVLGVFGTLAAQLWIEWVFLDTNNYPSFNDYENRHYNSIAAYIGICIVVAAQLLSAVNNLRYYNIWPLNGREQMMDAVRWFVGWGGSAIFLIGFIIYNHWHPTCATNDFGVGCHFDTILAARGMLTMASGATIFAVGASLNKTMGWALSTNGGDLYSYEPLRMSDVAGPPAARVYA